MNIHNKLRDIGFKRTSVNFFKKVNGKWVSDEERLNEVNGWYKERYPKFIHKSWTHGYTYFMTRNRFIHCNVKRDNYVALYLYDKYVNRIFEGKVTQLKGKRDIMNKFPKMARRDMVLEELFK